MTATSALVLAAGLGTRLRPLTGIRAKPAFPVAGEPLVGRILRWLARAGVRDALLNLHHRPESITAVVGDGREYGLRVRYSWESPILGSAGGPRRAFSLVDADELLVVNGDTLTDLDLGALGRAHRASGALVTLALSPHPDPARYGGVRIDRGGAYAGAVRAGRGAADAWHFLGVQLVRREALAALPDGAAAASIGGVYDALASRTPGAIRGWTTEAAFFDIGTPRTYLEASLALGGGTTVGRACRIDASAYLDRCVLWDEVTIDAGVGLRECIVADRVHVPRGSRYHRAVLLRAGAAPPGPRDRLDGTLHVAPFDPH